MSKTKKLGLFEGDAPRVRAVPPSAAFLDLLAQRLVEELTGDDLLAHDPFALSDAIVLLPNRRATRALIDTFAERGDATLLPTIRPLADFDDDPDVWGPDPIALDIEPAIDLLRRRLELAALIRAKEEAEGGVDDPSRAVAVADELCKLMDSAAAADHVDWSRLPNLVQERDLAAHWRQSAKFLEIVSDYWPARLAAERLTDPAARRTKLLDALADQWEKNPPKHPVIIAGSTGSVAAVRRLMIVVSKLPRGVVILPGLDSDLDDSAWNEIEPQHPQYGLRTTLRVLNMRRQDVPLLKGAEETAESEARRVLIREALAPAVSTADWIARLNAASKPWGDAGAFVKAASQRLSIVETRTEEEEAGVAALLLREVLETPGRTAALVTPDLNLARRVEAKLFRWGVDAGLSAGEPLADLPHGLLLTILANLAYDDADPVTLAALLHHKLTHFAPDLISTLEREHLRGARRHADLADLIRRAGDARSLLEEVHANLAPLRDCFTDKRTTANAFAVALAATMEAVGSGPQIWMGRAGDSALKFLTNLTDHGDALGHISRRQAPRLIRALMKSQVAPDQESHPRIAVWGPLEARLQRRDLIILGGLNEGVWPAPPADDPFLSRAMRADLGLPPVDARVGLAAHDFAQLANAPEVVLTRSARAGSAPSVASRWVWRLETLARGAGCDLSPKPESDPRLWARALDEPERVQQIKAPRPTPAAAGLKLNRLSVTDVEKLIRDPYAIYAKRILGLEVLRPIGAPADVAERGSAIHKALELFQERTPATREEDIAALSALIEQQLSEYGFPPERRTAERARLAGAAADFVDWSTKRRAENFTPLLERLGKLEFDGRALTGRADRIDVRPDGKAEIVDYKTGTPPSDKQVSQGLAPQLLLEAAMLKAGAFEKVTAAETGALVYWRFAGSDPGCRELKFDDDVNEAAAEAFKNLRELLAKYDRPEQPYLSKPRVQLLSRQEDYDHLARRKEWAESEGE